jgi:hypothetical protein
MKITCKLTGDTQNFIRNISKFSRTLLTEVVQTTDNVGHMLVFGTRETIDSQNFTGLSTVWFDFKSSHGYDTSILKMLHIMYSQISYKRMHTSSSMVIGKVGFLSASMHPRMGFGSAGKLGDKARTKLQSKRYRGGKRGSSISTAQLAGWHEEGIGNVPARPFFAPTAKRYEQRVYSAYGNAVARAWASL